MMLLFTKQWYILISILKLSSHSVKNLHEHKISIQLQIGLEIALFSKKILSLLL